MPAETAPHERTWMAFPREGHLADLVVLDGDPFVEDGLLGSSVAMTLTGGRFVHRRRVDD